MSGPDRPARCPRDGTCRSSGYHDTDRGYIDGCRSPAALDAHAEHQAAWRAGERPRRVDATGTVRRLRALLALGHTCPDLGARVYLNYTRVRRYVNGEYPTVLSTTADRFATLYVELAEADPPPNTPARARQRRVAAERGYDPPAAWDDATIDDPAARPWVFRPDTAPDDAVVDAVRHGVLAWADARPVDRRHAVTVLRDGGRELAQIAADLRADPDEVRRIHDQVATAGRRARRAAQRREAEHAARAAKSRTSDALVEKVRGYLAEHLDPDGCARVPSATGSADLGIAHATYDRAVARLIAVGGAETVVPRRRGRPRPPIRLTEPQSAAAAEAA